jgi:chromosome segregation ATPase
MNKTNVDEMLLQMIEPKVHEIQTRFSSGQGLTSEDINTLLLKSQYNHINHLDEKLNEVTADVSSLKSDFKLLESKFDNLESNLKASMTAFESNIEFKIQKAINSNMRWSIGLIAFLVTVLKLIDVLAAKLPNIF